MNTSRITIKAVARINLHATHCLETGSMRWVSPRHLWYHLRQISQSISQTVKSISQTVNQSPSVYPLVNIQRATENHHLSWVNQQFLWPFPIANCCQRVALSISRPCEDAEVPGCLRSPETEDARIPQRKNHPKKTVENGHFRGDSWASFWDKLNGCWRMVGHWGPNSPFGQLRSHRRQRIPRGRHFSECGVEV